jgi:hypothetical protein
MTRADLAAAGAALYGARWQTALADALGVNDRTVRRWAACDLAVPGPVEAALLGLLAARMTAAIRPQKHARVALTVYRSDAELAELTGEGWSAAFHRALMARVAAALPGGAELVEIDAEKYRRWLGAAENSQAARAAFAAGALRPPSS